MESRSNLIASSPAWARLLDGSRVSVEGRTQGKAEGGLLEVTGCALQSPVLWILPSVPWNIRTIRYRPNYLDDVYLRSPIWSHVLCVFSKLQTWSCLRINCLGRYTGSKREEVRKDWRNLHNKDLHSLYCLLYIISKINLRRMRWEIHVEHDRQWEI